MSPRPPKPVRSGLRAGRRPARVLLGVGLSILVLGVFLVWIGPERVVTTVRMAALAPIALAVVVSVWSLGLRIASSIVLLRQVGFEQDRSFILVYLATGLPRNLLPGGYAAGAAIISVGLARHTSTPFERVLAPLSVAEVYGFAAPLVVASTGAAFLGGVVVVGGRPWPVAGAVVVGVGLFLAVALLGVVRADWLARLTVGGGRLVRASLGRIPPTRYLRPLMAGRAGDRVAGFRMSVQSITAAPSGLILAFALSVAAWVTVAIPLWLSLAAVGASVPVAVVLVAVPTAGLMGILPLPGGLGGIELALVALVTGFTGVDPAVATSGVLVYRLVTFWLEVGLAVPAVLMLGWDPVPE